MAQTNSFDVVSRVDMQEVQNAVHQATKEMQQRYDFRESKSTITLNANEHEIVVLADDDFKLKSVVDILQGRLHKRGISLKALNYGKVEPAAGAAVRQRIGIQSGIDTDRCKAIVKFIKGLNLKVQAQIQDEQVRVSGVKKDDLQAVMQQLRAQDFDFHMEFTNYR
jgi:hypothetical protein